MTGHPRPEPPLPHSRQLPLSKDKGYFICVRSLVAAGFLVQKTHSPKDRMSECRREAGNTRMSA